LLDPVLGNRAPYGIYLIATVFVVWRAGFGPGVATVLSGALLARYLFEDPRWTLALVTEANYTALVMSLTIGMVIVLLCESLRVTAINNARLYSLARQADARKDEFLATLAHELRNPLAPIRNAVYLLNSLEPRDPRAEELHQLIACQTDHLVHLVNDLLDVARITRGKVELKLSNVTVQTIVDTAVTAIRPALEEKSQSLQIRMPPGNVHLNADLVRMTQVLTNLLDNAVKYTNRDGRLWLSADLEGNQISIRVRDTGIGIAPEHAERIFNLFEQANTELERGQGGLGIGLTLVRSLVHMHGGTVEAASPGLGLGSEFVLRLPVTSIEEADPLKLESENLGTLDLPSLRVLVVDDSRAAATSLANVLRLWKLKVAVCLDGFAALELARTFKPDVILADLGMPRMHGFQLAEEIRRLPGLENVILIAVTGYGQPADLERSKACGFAHHLVKPIDPAELKNVLGAKGNGVS
jgi:signal transduction histidine kinase/CheY-like chemotaxis protein